jgi:hypothetical protein
MEIAIIASGTTEAGGAREDAVSQDQIFQPKEPTLLMKMSCD